MKPLILFCTCLLLSLAGFSQKKSKGNQIPAPVATNVPVEPVSFSETVYEKAKGKISVTSYVSFIF